MGSQPIKMLDFWAKSPLFIWSGRMLHKEHNEGTGRACIAYICHMPSMQQHLKHYEITLQRQAKSFIDCDIFPPVAFRDVT